jgi:molybdopterin synthase sulfur carrier subunit
MADKVSVRIPTPLRGHTDGASSVELPGATVGEVLQELTRRHEKLRGRLFDDKGDLNRFVNVFLNDEDIRFLQGLDSKVKDGDGVKLVPAIAGGSWARSRRCGSTEANRFRA